MINTTITPKVVDAAVWALLGYSKSQQASNANFPDLDWNVQRSWLLSEVRVQVALALIAASDIFATEQAARVARLQSELVEREAELIYLRKHGKDGALWLANHSKDVWRDMARASLAAKS